MDFLQAVIIAVVEGITEFLPVSSTGHMIITSSLLGIEKEEFTKLFEVAIQFGFSSGLSPHWCLAFFFLIK